MLQHKVAHLIMPFFLHNIIDFIPLLLLLYVRIEDLSSLAHAKFLFNNQLEIFL